MAKKGVGFVKLERSKEISALMKKPKYFVVYCYLKFNASYAKGPINIIFNGQALKIGKNQMVTSLRKIARETNIKFCSVRSALDYLSKVGLITLSPCKKFSLIECVDNTPSRLDTSTSQACQQHTAYQDSTSIRTPRSTDFNPATVNHSDHPNTQIRTDTRTLINNSNNINNNNINNRASSSTLISPEEKKIFVEEQEKLDLIFRKLSKTVQKQIEAEATNQIKDRKNKPGYKLFLKMQIREIVKKKDGKILSGF